MPDDTPTDVTALLQAARDGDEIARNRLIETLYDELRRLASRQVGGQHGPDGLAPTALVHECFLRLVGRQPLDCENRRHFFGIAARVMRDVLVDEARRRSARKRGGDRRRVPLDAAEPVFDPDADDLIGLGEAVETLNREDPVSAEIVMLRFFGGLTYEQVAELVDLPVIRVRREWAYAKAWLQRRLG